MTFVLHCEVCRHYWGDGKCDAFPDDDGIPTAIIRGDHDHRKPFKGDNGVRFEAMGDVYRPPDAVPK